MAPYTGIVLVLTLVFLPAFPALGPQMPLGKEGQERDNIFRLRLTSYFVSWSQSRRGGQTRSLLLATFAVDSMRQLEVRLPRPSCGHGSVSMPELHS